MVDIDFKNQGRKVTFKKVHSLLIHVTVCLLVCQIDSFKRKDESALHHLTFSMAAIYGQVEFCRKS